MGDRHVVPRSYKSGAEKRKNLDEKNKKAEEVLSKTPKISSFFAAGSFSAASGASAAGATEVESSAFCDPVHSVEKSSASCDADSVPDKVEEKVSSNFEKDVGMWSKLSEKEIDYWIANGPIELHHCDDKKFETCSVNQERGDVTGFRKYTKSLFFRKVQNETVFRNWLCFSPYSGKLYCFVCKLMDRSVSSFSREGNCTTDIPEHNGI